MNYKITFTIDNGCREDKHVAVVVANSNEEAISKLKRKIILGYDESIKNIQSTQLENVDVLFCTFKLHWKNV